MMFHCADPDENGLGVTTFMPSFAKSGQSVMCFGFPLRTTRETTESVIIPLYVLLFQDDATIPSFTSWVTPEPLLEPHAARPSVDSDSAATAASAGRRMREALLPVRVGARERLPD